MIHGVSDTSEQKSEISIVPLTLDVTAGFSVACLLTLVLLTPPLISPKRLLCAFSRPPFRCWFVRVSRSMATLRCLILPPKRLVFGFTVAFVGFAALLGSVGTTFSLGRELPPEPLPDNRGLIQELVEVLAHRHDRWFRAIETEYDMTRDRNQNATALADNH